MTRVFRSRLGFLLLNWSFVKRFGVDEERGALAFVGVCGSKKEFGFWEQLLGSRLAKGLKRESKVSVDD